MQIEVLSVSQPAFTKTEKGGYSKIEVAYKNDGKVQGKQLVDFKYPEVYKFFTNSKQGDVVDIVAEKNGKYWNWTSAGVVTGNSEETKNSPGSSDNNNDGGVRGKPIVSGRGRVTGSNYETPEERARRQVYIVRQSSVSNAIATLAREGTKALAPQEVLQIARIYESFVFGEEQNQGSEATKAIEESDIPF